jgi:hypothetical protein
MSERNRGVKEVLAEAAVIIVGIAGPLLALHWIRETFF